MINKNLLNEKAKIDNLINAINGYQGDPYIKSLLTYYLCIQVSGFLENSIRIIFSEYALPRSKDNVKNYISSKLEKFPNPNWSAIIILADNFSQNWVTDLKKSISQNQLASLESINVNRNAIAHGGSSNITLNDLLNYYNDVVLLITDLEKICS